MRRIFTNCFHIMGLTGVLLALSGTPPAPLAHAAVWVRSDVYAANGMVKVTAVSGSTVYLGGTFTKVGLPARAVVRLSESTGGAIRPFLPQILQDAINLGYVHAVALDGFGGYFIGGYFASIGGVPRQHLAQIDANGNLTPWNPSADQQIESISYNSANGTVYVVGSFENIGGLARHRLAAIDATTGIVTTWNPTIVGFVNTLSVMPSGILLAGNFSTINGAARENLAFVDQDTATLLPWTSTVNSPGNFRTVATHPGRICVATVVQAGTTFHFISETSGQELIPPVSCTSLEDLAVGVIDPATLTTYIGGSFTNMGGITRLSAAAIDVNGSVTAWNPKPNQGVRAIELGAGGVILGGGFTQIGTTERCYLASVTMDTGAPTAWNPAPDSYVSDLVKSGDVVYAVGDIKAINNVSRMSVAAINASTGAVLPWAPNVGGEVHALLKSGNKVWIGGFFGAPGANLTAVDALTGATTGWPTGVGSTVLTLGLAGNTLYVGGGFATVGGIWRQNLAAVDATTGTVLPWNPGADGAVRSLQAVGGEVVVGGDFAFVGGTSRNRLARINAVSGNGHLSWPANITGAGYSRVNHIAVVTDQFGALDRVYIAGIFTGVGFATRNNFACVDRNFGFATDWDPNATGVNSWDAVEGRAVLPVGSRVYVGGVFPKLGGVAQKAIGVTDATTGALLDWNPGIEDYGTTLGGVHSLAMAGTTLFAGGQMHAPLSSSPGRNFLGILDAAITAVGDAKAPVAPSRVRATPNPFGAATLARFTLAKPGEADLAVFDVSGRKVKTLHRGTLQAGAHAVPWDGTDDRGSAVASGIYYFRAKTADEALSAKLHRLK